VAVLAPFGDDFGHPASAPAHAFSGSTDLTHASREPGEPDHAGVHGTHSVWFAWTPTTTETVTWDTAGSAIDTLLAAYTGSSLQTLSLVAANDDADGTPQSRVTFQAVAGVRYMIAFDTRTAGGTVIVNLHEGNPPANKPANDDFANAMALSGASGAPPVVSSVNATREAGEPVHAGYRGDTSVWYSWTAPASGMVVFDTFGSDIDTMLGIYTGSSVSALTQVAANDDASGQTQSEASFNAVAGTRYMIAVDGWQHGGSIHLKWRQPTPPPTQAPANDNFANAMPLSGATGSAAAVSSVYATREAGEPIHAGYRGDTSVWYAWTAPANGTVTFDTFGSDIDTMLGIYTGTGVSALTQVAANDDANGTSQSQAGFTAVAGTRYMVAVDGWQHGGTIHLRWTTA
jgi:hypothetical protein